MIEVVVAPNPGPFTLNGTRSYVIDGSVVIDPGPAVQTHIDALLSAAPALSAVFVTHRHADHAPAAARLREHGATVHAPSGAVAASVLDVELSDGQKIDLATMTITAIATPGHTGEHFCYLTPEGDLFTGDTILGEGTTAIFPPDGHMGDYLRSLEKLRQLKPLRIHPGHGPMRADAIELIDSYIRHRRMRERQIEEVLSEGSLSIQALRQIIYPELDARLAGAADLQLEAHLITLEEEGRAARIGNVWQKT